MGHPPILPELPPRVLSLRDRFGSFAGMETRGDQIITLPVVITASQTEHVVINSNQPEPPTGLTATVN
jgi:hypothetical protein